MASRKHLTAVNRSIRAAGIDTKGLDAALVELLRDLARKMDASGADGPASRLTASYLSAQKDLARAAARKQVVRVPENLPGEPVVPAGLHAVERTPLDKLRDKKARSA